MIGKEIPTQQSNKSRKINIGNITKIKRNLTLTQQPRKPNMNQHTLVQV